LSILVIGAGNDCRRDDGFGIAVARLLASRELEGVEVRELSGEGGSILAALEDRNQVYLVDAVRSGAEPGEMHRLDAGAQTVPSSFFHYSSHDFAVAEALEMARVLDRLPAVTVVYGVEGELFDHGIGLSEPVQARVREVADRIQEEISASTCR
jgi:hydrogenase maturation protease